MSTSPQAPSAPLLAPVLAELEQEAVSTRRLFERLPEDRLDWRPHAKSYTLGQLALHVATIPAIVTGLMATDELDAATVDFTQPQPQDVGQVREAFESSLAGARQALAGWQAGDLLRTWRLFSGEKTLFELPRGAMLRSIVMNHFVHHRAQLALYLRLLDVPLPSVYGPTADENPFAT